MKDGRLLLNEYRELVTRLDVPSFDGLRQLSVKLLLENFTEEERDELWQSLGHGKRILDDEALLLRYLYAFGIMHQKKMRLALSRIANLGELVAGEYSLVDWGCGQGLASVCFLDYIKEFKEARLPTNTLLIEPSHLSLDNARFHLAQYGVNDIHEVEKCIDDVNTDDVVNDSPITIHLLSNILDVETFSLKHLAQLISLSSSGDHYLICVSPYYPNSQRFQYFKNFFIDTSLIAFENVIQNELEIIAEESGDKTQYGNFTLEMLVFKFLAGKSSLVDIEYYPPVQFFAAYQLDLVSKNRELLSKLEIPFWTTLSAFDVVAPFEFGASVYDDVHPILATLSNIVTRGMPTKASPMLEELFSWSGNTELPDYLGSMQYDGELSDDETILFAQIYSPVGVARLQKVILEAIIAGRLSFESRCWRILVQENDVPCAALAICDFEEMFHHITSLSKDYKNLSLPKIDLCILSNERWADSPLHLSAKVCTQVNEELKSREYDIVVEISMLEELNRSGGFFREFNCPSASIFSIGSTNSISSKRRIYTSDIIEYQPLGAADRFGVFKENVENLEHLVFFLNLLFRKRSFREGQVPILNRALQNKNVIGLLPTGGGKSLTYQLAAMLQPGVTIVVDPLRSLMTDQYEGLLSNGIDSCCFINSLLDPKERLAAEKRMESSEVQFVFMSPERLCIYEFRERLRIMHDLHVYFSYGVIDEVHCVSEWGHDFRFSYLHLGRNLYNYVHAKQENKPIALFGLTATASFDVLSDVERELSGNGAYELDANTIIRYENTDRIELQYKIEKVPISFLPDKWYDRNNYIDASLPRAISPSKWNAYDCKRDYLAKCIRDIPKQVLLLQSQENICRIKQRFADRQNSELSYEEIDLVGDIPANFFAENDEYTQAGIVFCPHRGNTGVSVFENQESLSCSIANIGTFVGASENDDAHNEEESFRHLSLFKQNKQPLMIATKAFGMGIDKPNVRFTVNMNYPSSLESFVQEAGRAGRDRKMSLAVILVSDFRIARISPTYQADDYPLMILKGRWFYEEDLHKVLDHYDLEIPESYIDVATADTDWVRLNCHEHKKPFNPKKCNAGCPSLSKCNLKNAPDEARGWHLLSDLKKIMQDADQHLALQHLEYLSADYESNMFFFNNNFKGEIEEKRSLFEIFCRAQAESFLGNDRETKPGQEKTICNVIDAVLSLKPEQELVAFLKYPEEADSYAVADIQKAIYRLCCIGFIDDYTCDYANEQFRIVAKRKADGAYYAELKQYLTRYYAEQRAEDVVKRVPGYKGENEVQKCLGFLIEFIYEKIAVKRKRALDDIRAFCASGIEGAENWIETNESLKDYIYYYFNSKYANEDYLADNGEPFSLTVDTDWGKQCSTDVVLKYLRVVDDDLVGSGGTPIDNIKHLQGAVRLIRRSLTDTNPSLALLNCFCLIQLGCNNSEALERELIEDFRQGFIDFASAADSAAELWDFYYEFNNRINAVPHRYDLDKLANVSEELRASLHLIMLRKFSLSYTALLGEGEA